MAQQTIEQVRSLEKAVNTAFFVAGLKTADLYGGVIKHTNLIWQCPPLKSQERLLGVPLEQYFECHLPVNTERVYDVWVNTLQLMYTSPLKAISPEGDILSLRRILGVPYSGQHKFRFSVPEGFPRPDDPYAGIIFSLEMADMLMNSTPWEATRTENDYYVTTDKGQTIGVKGGKPAVQTPWDADCSGMVWEFLSMPRGRVSRICLYDPLDKLRSLLHEHKKDFKEFPALDYAIQALRCLYKHGAQCRILSTAAHLHKEGPNFLSKQRALKAAQKIMLRREISDRAKIAMLYAEMVPSVYSESGFSVKIYNLGKVAPYTLADSVITRINNRIAAELAKLPIDLQEPL